MLGFDHLKSVQSELLAKLKTANQNVDRRTHPNSYHAGHLFIGISMQVRTAPKATNVFPPDTDN